MTWAWISAAPSKMLRMRASHKNAGNRVFQRKAVAAMDLQGIVGGRPGNPRTEQLGHAGFQVAAFAAVFLPGREIGQLARDHQLDGHQRNLSATRGN